ncbi:MAG: PAS domain S-box protein [Prolixibacteraceae bacterium]|nr:PAS domain S-box protein [Prolixibacteraceae bacterium]
MHGEKKINYTGFNRFFKNSIAVMLLIDPDTFSIADANPAAEKFYGWNRSRLVQMHIDQINTLSPEAIEVEMEKARKQERSYFRFKHRKANGMVCPVEVFSSKVEINGKTYLHSIIHDITQTVEAEQKLQEYYKLFKNLAAQVPGVVYQYRLYPDGRSAFPYSSPGMWNIYEVTPEQVQKDASPVFTRLHPDDYDYIVETINNSAKNLTVYTSEFRVILPEQGLRWRKCDARPERLEDGSTLWHGIIIDITDLKTTEEALKTEENKFRQVFEAANVGKSITLPTGEINVNRAFCNILGYTQEELQNTKWQDITPPEEIAPTEALIAKLLNGEKDSLRFEKQYIHKTGKKVWADVSVGIHRDNEGKPLFFITTVIDINEKKRAEQELFKSEALQKSIIESTPLATYSLNSKGIVLRWNKAAEIMFGWKEDEVLGKLLPMVPENKLDEFAQLRKRVLNGESLLGIELRRKRKDGYFIDCNLFAAPIIGPDGKVTGILAMMDDITERKRAEIELQHTHELMRYIIEHNQSAVAVHDRQMNYVYVSQRYLNDYRVKEKDIIGRNHYDVFPDLPQKWRDVHQRALKGEVLGADNDPFYRDDGTVDYTRWECRPWYEADGSIGGIIVYTEVINEQIKREQEIKQLNERLKILIDVEKELSSAKTIETVQKIVVTSARKLTGSDGATLVLKENGSCHFVDEDAKAPLWKGKKFPFDQCISGWTMEHEKPVVIEDIYSDERIPVDSYKTTFVKSLVMVPVSINSPIGAIGNYWDKKHKADKMEVALIETLADATARAIENIQLREGLESKIEEKTKELKERVEELERFYHATIEREFRIKELRDEINRLKGNA